MKSFIIWLSTDENGNAAVSLDGADDAARVLLEDGAAAVRTVKLPVNMTLPIIQEVPMCVPDDDAAAVHVGPAEAMTQVVMDDATACAAIDKALQAA